MAQKPARPVSPHLTIWKWGPGMLVSILNRAMGIGLATLGVAGITWWLASLATGPEAYETFLNCMTGWCGKICLVGISFAFFFHLLGGLRHFVMDAGAGFELVANRNWAWAVVVGSAMLTAILWLAIYGKGLY
jgi:succinate dehydrogenase / fumarate reductase, cytochrome b subunit